MNEVIVKKIAMTHCQFKPKHKDEASILIWSIISKITETKDLFLTRLTRCLQKKNKNIKVFMCVNKHYITLKSGGNISDLLQ